MSAELADEWIAKAEEDYHDALTMMRQRRHPLHNAVCFHSQQCAEKDLKAFLARHDIRFGKTHELGELCRQAMSVDDNSTIIAEQAHLLDPYAVEFRYPGASANSEDAREAVAAMKAVRKFVRGRLGIG